MILKIKTLLTDINWQMKKIKKIDIADITAN